MQKSKLLVEGEFVITMDKNRRVLKNAAVYVEDGKIVAVGSVDDLKSRYKADQIIGGKGRIVMPGFINAHDHLFLALTRSLGDDLPLLDWLKESVFPAAINLDENAFYVGAKLCLAEMVKSGITFFMDDSMQYVSFELEKAADLVAQAVKDIGIGGIVGSGAPDMNLDAGVPEVLIKDKETILKTTVNLINKYNRNPEHNISIWADAGYPLWCSAELFKGLKRIADEYGTWIYTHAAEARDEVKITKRMTGKTSINYLDDLGVLDSNCQLAHVIWIDDEELQKLSKTNTKISHQPICNQFLASGVARIPDMLKMGITVGLGIDDGGHSNEDFFGLMKHCALMHKVNRLDATAITAEQVLEMATIKGAEAVGMSETMGSLEVGKKANIIVINQNKINLTPKLRPVTNLVYGATAENVETTIIDGNVVMENRYLHGIDESKVMEDAEKEAWKLVEKSGLEHLVTRSTQGWELPAI